MSSAMSLSYLNHFPIEKINVNTIQLFFLIFGLVEFFFLHMIQRRINKFLSRSMSSIQYQLSLSDNSDIKVGKKNQNFVDDGSLCREEVEMVMGKLGIFCHPEGEKLPERLGSDENSNLFEEKEPSLDEVKGAFDVFDENRDGFIDAGDLQRVLCALGLKNRAEMENCKGMIRVFDENGDGRIDFNEFVKLMESSFC